MLSNRASAQRSRQRRQNRLDQLEVLTAQLRVENASLLRKSNLALQLARKFEAENKKLMEKAQNLTNELAEARKMVPATRRLHEESHSSPNTCPDFSEIVGEADLSPVVKLKLENAPDDDNKPLQSVVSKSYVTVDDQMEMGYTSEDADMTADCNNKTAESHKIVQVSDSGSPVREVKMASVRSPGSCKTGCKSTEVFQLPSSLPQESVFTPVKEVPVMNPMTYSQDLFEEMRDLFESETADDPDSNNEILNTMDQTWLNSFAECLNA
jgi:hypothetical protein